MKIRWQYVLGGLLALLGFNSCKQIGLGRVEYGQPNANFKLIGDVTDAAGKPVEGIRVVTLPRGEDQPSRVNDTTYSDAKGHFEVERMRYDWPDEFEKGAVKLEDLKGHYNTRVLKRADLSVEQTKKGSGSWYEGDYTITANTQLEKAE